MRKVADDIYAELTDEVVGGQTLAATRLSIGPMREPDGSTLIAPCVFIQETGIGDVRPYMGANTVGDISTETLRLLVVGDRENYQAARDLQYGLIEFLHRRSVTNFLSILVQNATPQPFEDAEGRVILASLFRVQWFEQRSA